MKTHHLANWQNIIYMGSESERESGHSLVLERRLGLILKGSCTVGTDWDLGPANHMPCFRENIICMCFFSFLLFLDRFESPTITLDFLFDNF